MSRYSDVWIVLCLASIAGWQNWERIEPELSTAVAVVVQSVTSPATADVETSVVAETTQDVQAPLEVEPQQFDTTRMRIAGPFDCWNAPPGYVIIHNVHTPACGPPIICWGY